MSDRIFTISVYWIALENETRQDAIGLDCHLSGDPASQRHVTDSITAKRKEQGVITRPETMGEIIGKCAAFLSHMGRQLKGEGPDLFQLETISEERLQTPLGTNDHPKTFKHIPLTDSDRGILFAAYLRSFHEECSNYAADRFRHKSYNMFGPGDFRGRNDFDRQC